jgi:hypothetical protein
MITSSTFLGRNPTRCGSLDLVSEIFLLLEGGQAGQIRQDTIRSERGASE